MPASRIDRRMARVRGEGRAALVTFIMAGDPDPETSLAVMKAIARAGADIIELGMPFSDPMADGPAIQAAGLRAIAGGQTLARTLAMAAGFRRDDDETPIVLMGYYNPILARGVARSVAEAAAAGIDALIVVDLPPEMDAELRVPAHDAGIELIRMVAPATQGERLRMVLRDAGGFVYCVSRTGVTGGSAPDTATLRGMVDGIRATSNLPVCVGFGIRSAADVETVGGLAEGVVVGTAMVEAVAGGPPQSAPARASALTRTLRAGLRRDHA